MINEVDVFVKFLKLVQKHFREECDINFYAQRLDTDPDALARIIWETSDSNLSEWVETMKKYHAVTGRPTETDI